MSDIQVNISLSKKQQGALWLKCQRLEKERDALKVENEYLKEIIEAFGLLAHTGNLMANVMFNIKQKEKDVPTAALYDELQLKWDYGMQQLKHATGPATEEADDE